MKILILGGTNFLGPHLVEELLKNGHEVTLFNRGKKQAPNNVEALKGDRDGSLDALQGRFWDAVIDTSGHLPRLVEASSKLLVNATTHYTFISTIGVYKDFLYAHNDENYPLATLSDSHNEEITEKTYGALKASCEKVIERYFPKSSLIIRPGLIVGPLDPTGRFSYWPLRVLEGGKILAPGEPTQPVQFIDVRDLAKWTVAMIERKETGIYNATGPSMPISFKKFLEECQSLSPNSCDFIWVEENFLMKHQVQDWVDLPLWLSSKRNMPGFLNASIKKALKAGLSFRPLLETLSAILKEEKQKAAGLEREREQELLMLWKNENTTEEIAQNL